MKYPYGCNNAIVFYHSATTFIYCAFATDFICKSDSERFTSEKSSLSSPSSFRDRLYSIARPGQSEEMRSVLVEKIRLAIFFIHVAGNGCKLRDDRGLL